MPTTVIDLTVSSEDEAPELKQARARRHQRMMQSIDRLRLRTQEEIEERERLYLLKQQDSSKPAEPSVQWAGTSPMLPPAPKPKRTRTGLPILDLSPQKAAVVTSAVSPPSAVARVKQAMTEEDAPLSVAEAKSEVDTLPAAEAKSDTEQQDKTSGGLYWAWHGSATCFRSSEAIVCESETTTTSEEPKPDNASSERFDWFGVRKRAKLRRDRIASAAVDPDCEEKRAVPANGEHDKGEQEAAAPGPFNLLAAMRRLKACWVETTTNGITFREYRPLPTRNAADKKGTGGRKKPDKKPVHVAATAKTAKAKAMSNPPLLIRRLPRATPAAPEFVIKPWPTDIPHLRTSFNKTGVKFAFESPFAGVCECPRPCVKTSCPNGILNIFCTPEVCDYKGKCLNGRDPHPDLRLARKRGYDDYTVIAVDKIEAGAVLGEYVGEIKAVSKEKKARDKPNSKPQDGYLYKVKRTSESHPNHTIYIDAARMGGITRFLNHSCNAPAVFEEVRNGAHHSVVVITTREVPAGAAVTVNYGTSLWFTCRCGEPSCQHRDLERKQQD